MCEGENCVYKEGRHRRAPILYIVIIVNTLSTIINIKCIVDDNSEGPLPLEYVNIFSINADSFTWLCTF